MSDGAGRPLDDTALFRGSGSNARHAMISFVRSLARQQARQDHNGSKDYEASCDLRPIFFGSAE